MDTPTIKDPLQNMRFVNQNYGQYNTQSVLSSQWPHKQRLLMHLFFYIFIYIHIFVWDMSSKRLEGNFLSKAPMKQDAILWELFDRSS